MVGDTFWRARGLAGTPFYERPEELEADSLVARGSDLLRLERTVGGSGSSRSSLWGEPGSGRSALFGALRRSARESGYLTAELMVGRETRAEMLLLRILDALYPEMALRAEERGGRPPILGAIRRLLLEAHGFQEAEGAESSLSAREVRASLFDLPTLFRKVAQEAQEELGVPGFVIHLRYADDLHASELAPAARTLRDARDLAILLPGYHYVVSGRQSVLRVVLNTFTQISSIFSTPLYLPPLEVEEVWRVLEQRSAMLSLTPERVAPVPVEQEAMEALYLLLEGNFGAMLQALNEGVARIGALAPDPTAPLALSWLAQALRVRAVEHLSRSLASGRMSQLGVLVTGFQGDPFTQGEARELWSLSRTAASEALSELVRAGFIRELAPERSGRGRPRQRYRLTGTVRLAFQSDALQSA